MAAKQSNPVIRAAGGVVWRTRDGVLEIAAVHRPRYDDWSLPKGKLEPGETELAAAVREVNEELGSEVAVSRRIKRISYDVGPARKQVDFWLMRHLSGGFRPDTEVDDVRWVEPTYAHRLLTYAVERAVLAEFTAVPVPEAVVVLLRHAKAGKRTEWRGDDDERPLDPSGLEQARLLVQFLRHFSPDRIVSARPLRCVQTVEPLAAELGMDIEVDSAFSDDEYLAAPGPTSAALAALVKPGQVTVVSSQGDTIPGLVEDLVPDVRSSVTRKGAAWVLCFVDGTVVSADYYGSPAR